MPIATVIADDHPLVLEGLVSLFEREPDIYVADSCHNGAEAIAAVKRHQPDILILDLRMPETNGLTVLAELKSAQMSTRVSMLTAELNDLELREAVRLGVRGLVLKALAPQFLVQCVRDVHEGKLRVEKGAVSNGFEKILQNEAASPEMAKLLTARESEILKHLAAGLRNSEIAKLLLITEGTVKMHIHNIYQKVPVSSRVALTRYAQEKGLL